MSGILQKSHGIWIAGLLTAVSLIIGMQSFNRVSFYQNQIKVRRQELSGLIRMQAGSLQQRAALDWINAHARHDANLAALIKQHLPGTKNDLVLREAQTVGGGWNIQRYDVRLSEIAPDKLGKFLAACENACPPVRIEDIQVSPGSDNSRGLLVQLALAEMISTTPQSAP